MRILVDGKEVLATYEFYYQGNFTGFAFRNLGGTYEVGPLMVVQAQETKTQGLELQSPPSRVPYGEPGFERADN